MSCEIWIPQDRPAQREPSGLVRSLGLQYFCDFCFILESWEGPRGEINARLTPPIFFFFFQLPQMHIYLYLFIFGRPVQLVGS